MISDLQHSQYGNLTSNLIVGGPTTCCSWCVNICYLLPCGYSNNRSGIWTKFYLRVLRNTHINIIPYNTTPHISATDQRPPILTYHIFSLILMVSFIKSRKSYRIDWTSGTVPGFTQWENTGVQMAKNLNVPVLVTEFNSVSCGGSNVSDTVSLEAPLSITLSSSSSSSSLRRYGPLTPVFNSPHLTWVPRICIPANIKFYITSSIPQRQKHRFNRDGAPDLRITLRCSLPRHSCQTGALF